MSENEAEVAYACTTSDLSRIDGWGPAAVDPAAIATLVATLGKLPPEQLLDLAIARLRAALPPGGSVPAPTPLRFQLVPLPHLGRSK